MYASPVLGTDGGLASEGSLRSVSTVRRLPGRKTVVTPVKDVSETSLTTRADRTKDGTPPSARWPRQSESSGDIWGLLRLTPLAPVVVEAVLEGRLAEGLGLPKLLEPLPADWFVQRDALGAGRAVPCQG